MLRLILIRHGETERNSEAKLQGGESDVPLNERGRKQAVCLGLALRGERLEAIYSSPLKRAFDTAQAISVHHLLKVQTVDALAELDMGVIDGLDLAEVKESLLGLQTWRMILSLSTEARFGRRWTWPLFHSFFSFYNLSC